MVCPESWVQFQGHCYYLVEDKYDMRECRAICRQKGGEGADLASIHSCVLGPVSLTRAVVTHMMERSSGMVAVVTCAEARLALPFMGTMAGYTHVRVMYQ